MNISFRAAGLAVVILLQLILLVACTESRNEPAPATEHELEAIARTEFTDRVENFFEYEPLRAGQSSQFRIHLTDLSDGSPVEQATVTLTVRPKETRSTLMEVTAKVGKVTGIYVADLNIPRAGTYDIEFHIRNTRVDERLPLRNFEVE